MMAPHDASVASSKPALGDLMRTLPPELLAHIFELGADINEEEGWVDEDEEEMSSASKDDGEANDTTAKKLPFQFVVASVCRSWREAVLSLPTLWSTLKLDLKYAVIHREAITEILKRTKAAPLTIDLTLVDVRVSEDPDVDPDDMAAEVALKFPLEMFRVLVSHSWHMRFLKLSCFGDALQYLDRFFRLVYDAPAAPLLEVFEVYVYEEEDMDELPIRTFEPQAMFGGVQLPRLRHLSLARAPFGWGSAVKDTIFSPSLRELHLLKYMSSGGAPSIATLLDILRCCPGLELLDLYHSAPTGSVDDWPLAIDSNTVDLPSIRSLHLAGMQPEHMRRFFALVPAPHLKDLRLWLNAIGVDSYDDFLKACVSPVQFFSQLERLELSGAAPITSDILERFLRSHSSVSDFTFQLSEMNRDQLAVLKYNLPLDSASQTADSTVLEHIVLPKLHTLRITAVEKGQSAPQLVDVLESRATALCPVQALYLDVKLRSPVYTDMNRWVPKIEYYELEEDTSDDDFESEYLEDDDFEGSYLDDDDIDDFTDEADEDWFDENML
ncbi:hypothetical protein BKA62DRAFT_716026 [Auriculariales sp. MPI-PUGE-AT-0066]|nr:hypothetical protein BKA62DRAFT_716026 [Auriculariales sp. MPI-PUGE-AT-0066]